MGTVHNPSPVFGVTPKGSLDEVSSKQLRKLINEIGRNGAPNDLQQSILKKAEQELRSREKAGIEVCSAGVTHHRV